MTINLTEILRKTMGRCPLKESRFVQVHESGQMYNSIKYQARINGGLANQLNIPLDMFDWRKVSIICLLGICALILISVNYLDRTAVSYFDIILIYFTFIALFNLFDTNRVSIDSEKLVIKTSTFESIKIPKYDINGIKIIDNVLYKYSWINLVLIILALLGGFIQALNLYDRIMRYAALEDAVLSIANAMFVFFIFLSIFYRSNRRSSYPKAIQVEIANKKITLYPRNEFEYNILKEELER